jgi:hypothetical protein
VLLAPVKKLRDDMESVRAAARTQDSIRRAVYLVGRRRTPAEKLLTPKARRVLRQQAPDATRWQVLDHCAAVVRLCAIYERFVKDIVEEWLAYQPSLHPRYEDLPLPVRDAHRLGIAVILRGLSSPRYSHLSERTVVGPYHDGLSGKRQYGVLADAYFADLGSLSQGPLERLMNSAGIANSWRWVANHPDMVALINAEYGNSGTAQGELENFIRLRHVAAHEAEITQILSVDELCRVARFLEALCVILAERIRSECTTNALLCGQAKKLGEVVHVYRNNVVEARMEDASLSVGEGIVLMREHSCGFEVVKSIKVGQTPRSRIKTRLGQTVGLQLSGPTGNAASLVRLLARP